MADRVCVVCGFFSELAFCTCTEGSADGRSGVCVVCGFFFELELCT